jgi:hypothetical protein
VHIAGQAQKPAGGSTAANARYEDLILKRYSVDTFRILQRVRSQASSVCSRAYVRVRAYMHAVAVHNNTISKQHMNGTRASACTRTCVRACLHM